MIYWLVEDFLNLEWNFLKLVRSDGRISGRLSGRNLITNAVAVECCFVLTRPCKSIQYVSLFTYISVSSLAWVRRRPILLQVPPTLNLGKFLLLCSAVSWQLIFFGNCKGFLMLSCYFLNSFVDWKRRRTGSCYSL
mgnify:CR=1 FL=1